MTHLQQAETLVRNPAPVRFVDLFNRRYRLYDDGSVWTNLHNKPLKSFVKKDGYVYYSFKPEKYKSKMCLLHRLLADNFIPNPENKTEVNHKDGNKLNNSLDNLEWVTSSENTQHAHKTKLVKHEPISGEHYIYIQDGKYRVQMRVEGKDCFFGGFDTLIEAVKRRNEVLKDTKRFSIV